MAQRKVLPGALYSCVDCLAWGVVGARRCKSCAALRHKYPGGDGQCAGCKRVLALKSGYCRLCWQQGAYESKIAGGLPQGAVSVLESGGPQHGHQLFFDRMKLRRAESEARKYGHRRGAPPKPPPAPAGRPAGRCVQLRLFEVARDFTRFDESTSVDLTNPWLRWAIYLAYQRGEARGWRRGVRFAVRRGLTIVLSAHVTGDVVRWSELFPAMRALGISTERVAEVLQEMSVLLDDRRPTFEGWLHRKLDGLAPGIGVAAEAWLRTMHDGGPRTKPREMASIHSYMSHVRPILLDWSARYDHLREVTSEDILAVLDGLHGSRRHDALVGLRRLFTFCRTTRVIFRDPTQGIRVGQRSYGIAQPLRQSDVDQAVEMAATSVARLVLVLAAVHAARKAAIIALRLDDIDLGNRRLTIAGRTRPLDELSHQILLEWLDYRRTRWPNTANPHLIINQKSAMGTGPVTGLWGKQELRGQAATLERLRVDRQLEEALTQGPDPLDLATVFGLDPKTAIHYAENARMLLVTAAEEQDPHIRANPRVKTDHKG
ncbi:MAG: integrase [Pseudonocardiaceae bacterium]